MPDSSKSSGRWAGLDIGDRRIGVAISDPLGITAQGLGVVDRASHIKDVAAIQAMLDGYSPDGFVAGLPLLPSGEEGDQADKVRHFCGHLHRITGMPIIFQDERMSTIESERVLIGAGVRRDKRKQVIDRLAATIILQAYLDAGGVGGVRP